MRFQDPFFGELQYVKVARRDRCYWEGERLFPPLNKTVEVFIDVRSPDWDRRRIETETKLNSSSKADHGQIF
jgi:hypothetical protein